MQVDESIQERSRDGEVLALLHKWSSMLPPRYAATRLLLYEGSLEKHNWSSGEEGRAAGLPSDYTTSKHLMLFTDCLAQ